MVTVAEVESILRLGHELRSFEVKGPGDRADKAYCANVARAAMAMANTRDGGWVCLGIDADQLVNMLPGLTPAQQTEWRSYDDVHDAMARYCDPPVNFMLHPLRLSSGVDVVVIEVAQFDQVPHVCRKDHPGVLRDGGLYVRPPGKPQSKEVPTALEMRELLELATTIQVRELLRRLGDIGVTTRAQPQSEGAGADELYSAEAAQAWISASDNDVIAELARRGHFDVSVRPGDYEPARIRPADLEQFVSRNAVRLRGWPLPFVGAGEPYVRGGSWMGQDISQMMEHLEAWRMCASGQFLHRQSLRSDNATALEMQPFAQGATGAVAVWEVLFYFVEVAEFAARMGADLGCRSVTIEGCVVGIDGRQLIAGDSRRDLPHGPYVIAADRLRVEADISTTELLRDPRGRGIHLAQGIFGQFGVDLPDPVLRDWQGSILGK